MEFLFHLYIPFRKKKILKTIEWIQSSMYKFKRQILKIRIKNACQSRAELFFISESRDRVRKYSSPRILIQLRELEMNASDKNTDFSSLDHNVAIA